MAVVRVGDAFSARVQRVALIACRKLFPLCARTLLNRDVRGKEREKTGTGKKLERNAFFPFPFLYFLTTFFFPFLAKIVKNG